MNNFKLLVINYIKDALNFGSLKKNKTKRNNFILTILGFGILFSLISFFCNYSFIYTIKETGGNVLDVIILVSAYTSMLNFSTCLFRSKGLAKSKDYELLKSMPITNKEIVSSKIFGLYIVELLYSIVILIPCGILVSLTLSNPIYILVCIILAIFITIFPILLSTLISTFITFLADGKRFYAIINVFVYLVFFILVFLISFSASSGLFTQYIDKFKYINPSIIFLSNILNGSYINILYFFIINIFMIIITIYIMALLFDRSYNIENHIIVKKNKKYKNNSYYKTMVNMEFKKLFNNKTYLINSLSGGIASIVCVAGLLITFYQSKEMLDSIRNYVYMFTFIPMLFSGIALPSSSTISIEGVNFYNLKSLPIKGKEILNIKLLVSYITTLCFSIVSCLILCIGFKSAIIDTVIIFLINISYLFFNNLFGLYLNTKHYKLHWTEEREVCKNSASVNIQTLLSFLFDIVISISFIFITLYINKILGFIFVLLLILIPSLCLYYYMNKNGDEIINKIE